MRAALVASAAGAGLHAAVGVAMLAGLATSMAADRLPYSVRWRADPDFPRNTIVEVSGVEQETLRALQRDDWPSAGWGKVLSVFAGRENRPADPAMPAMLGQYAVAMDDSALRFRPRFPLEQGVSYRAVFHPAHLPGKHAVAPAEIAAEFHLPPAPQQAATVVSEVYPSSATLPENLLKFYLHFSAPMQRGHVYDHIRLLGEAGKPVELPFLELDEELWNPEMTRLTIFIDPGRIKREVRPLEEIGPALEAGKDYQLVIDSAWLDSRRAPLRETFRKSFRVGPPDRDPPDPARWKVSTPMAGTTGALTVTFPEPIDYALALRMIRVADHTGATVEGTLSLSDHEARWIFTPKSPWQRGRHHLRIQKSIEDLAGNNIGKAFEVDLFERVERQFQDGVIALPFEVQ